MSSFVLATGDFVKTGGMDMPNYKVAEHLASRGDHAHLVAYRIDSDLASMPHVVSHLVPKVAGSYTLSAPLLSAATFRTIASVRPHPGRVIVNGGACPYPGINWVHYVHAAYTPETRVAGLRAAAHAINQRVDVMTERVALRLARRIIANSELTRRHLVELVGADPERIHTVYYGTDAAAFKPPSPPERARARERLGWTDDRPRVCFVGAMGNRRKGFDVLFEAWRALVLRSGWDAILVAIGAGAEVPAWKQRAQEAGLAGSVEFLGFRRDMPEILAGADALVAPTRYEAYGLGVHEALCTGLPAIVSRESGVGERYPASLQSLLLEDPNDAVELTQRLLEWRDHAEAVQHSVLDFSEVLRARTWEVMAKEVTDICDREAS